MVNLRAGSEAPFQHKLGVLGTGAPCQLLIGQQVVDIDTLTDTTGDARACRARDAR